MFSINFRWQSSLKLKLFNKLNDVTKIVSVKNGYDRHRSEMSRGIAILRLGVSA